MILDISDLGNTSSKGISLNAKKMYDKTITWCLESQAVLSKVTIKYTDIPRRMVN